MAKEIVWTGAKGRLLAVERPCPCGCDERDGNKGVGYINGSTADGSGFSIWIESEDVFQAALAVLQEVDRG